MAISPWKWGRAESPDGKLSAEVVDLGEIAMGAPMSGLLQISNGFEYDNCSPSIVWSDDSRYLAVPIWTRERQQQLIVIDVSEQKVYHWPQTYRVLELHSFAKGTIRGIDSPVYRPEEVSWELGDIVDRT